MGSQIDKSEHHLVPPTECMTALRQQRVVEMHSFMLHLKHHYQHYREKMHLLKTTHLGHRSIESVSFEQIIIQRNTIYTSSFQPLLQPTFIDFLSFPICIYRRLCVNILFAIRVGSGTLRIWSLWVSTWCESIGQLGGSPW